MSWLGGTVRRWIALVSLALTFAGLGALAAEAGRNWDWLVIVGLGLLAASFAWTARDEHRRRIAADQAHRPPGGGIPLRAPVEYQVAALRQAIPRLAESMDDFGEWELEEVLKNLPRQGVDPIYEPLRFCDEGLARLAELGELEVAGRGWRVVKGR